MKRLDVTEIEAAFDAVARRHVVLFGSYARGEAYRNSDVDILLLDERYDGWSVYPEGDTSTIDVSWSPDWPPLHIVTASPAEFRRRYCNDEATAVAIAEDGCDIQDTFAFADFVQGIDCPEEE